MKEMKLRVTESSVSGIAKPRPGSLWINQDTGEFYVLSCVKGGMKGFVCINLVTGHFWDFVGTIDEAVDGLTYVGRIENVS